MGSEIINLNWWTISAYGTLSFRHKVLIKGNFVPYFNSNYNHYNEINVFNISTFQYLQIGVYVHQLNQFSYSKAETCAELRNLRS